MSNNQDIQADGTVLFLPHRLNRHPAVVRGLTADELWVCCGLSALAGLVLGIPAAMLLSTIALVPSFIVAAIALGIFFGGGMLRRQKRGRPETWLYRHIQWWLALRHPGLAGLVGGQALITRSGYWSTKRWTTR
ncbi:TIGR03750 family conjugal transfer protein [Pseudomonas aeruginosa]|uniref:TIGR03750 family conjugal transfer protein n=1 Tax=Pseudomonas aeruginosa TaxID=287 RepID=UPI000F7EAFA5|nr:TIGR03750 family conjugal transfer protein [Pseudomonas aeruginosa]RTB44131.1 TIGR03750 family conjugal transfer protein [Pseudomonas aeruginosa]